MNTTLADIDSPIYQQLVQEHGDVVAEARATADRTQRQAGELLDWGGQKPNQEWFGGRSPGGGRAYGGETSQQQRPAHHEQRPAHHEQRPPHQEQRAPHQEQRPAQSEGRPSGGQGPAGQSPTGQGPARQTSAGQSPGEQFFGSRPPQTADAEA